MANETTNQQTRRGPRTGNRLSSGSTPPFARYAPLVQRIEHRSREVFAVLNLKTNGQPINLNICSMGTLDSSIVSPREIFKSSILSNAGAFIGVHNHPSGSISPSQEDKDVTKRLLSCSELLGIRMLDHIIIGGETGDMYSFKSEGLLDQLRPPRAVWER